jgi:hypothetical protein
MAFVRGVVFVAAFLAATAMTRAAPADLGPEVALSEPSGGYVGKLALSPTHAPVGAKVRVSGMGFPPGQSVDIAWRTVNGRWKVGNGEYHGREYIPAAYRIAAATPDASGVFVVEFTTPEDFGYAHDIVVQQGKRLLTQAGFNLDMSWEVSPKAAPIGAPVTIDIKGIGWRQLENSWDLAYDNAFVGWVSSVGAHGSARFTIPATGAVGEHVLKLIHGEFTFPYLNPQQNPRPDRPRFEASFTLTPGAPVLPPPAAEQTQKTVRGLPAPGALVVEPAFAALDAPVTVRGKGLTPGKSYALAFGTMSGNRVGGGGFDEAARDIATASADARGEIAFAFKAPDDLGGAHRLWIRDAPSNQQGYFTIVPSALPLTASSGPAGAPFSVHLKGVGWTETANIHTIVYDNNHIGYACGFNSQGDVEVFLNGAGAPGWHFIDVYPAIYKGEEIRPNNFRIPQLTYAADHPGEDLPTFHFAFEVREGATSAASR